MTDKKSFFYYNFVLIVICLLGVFLRIKLWFLNQDMHCDEANLALNMLEAGYLDLFKPLERLQVAPPGFLILSKLIYNIFKLHPTPWTSDFILRFVPLLSGVLSLPAFAYFLNSFTKNKIIVIVGTLFLAVNPAAISYSCIFKQYSTELLISIFMMIFYTHIDFIKNSFKKNAVWFILLGLTPLFSMTAYFIMPCGFIYLFIKALQQKSIKKFLLGGLIFSIPFFLNIIFILLPIYTAHYTGMENFWEYTLGYIKNFNDYIKIFIKYEFRIYYKIYQYYIIVLFYLGSLIMLFKNFKSAFLVPFIIYITYLFSVYKGYPISERFLVFLVPFYITTIIYPLILIPDAFIKRYKTLLCIFLLVFTYYCYKQIVDLRFIKIKQESSRAVWEYYIKNCDQSLPLIEGFSLNSNEYYKKLYNKNNNIIHWKKANDIPAGDYYIIITRYSTSKNILLKDSFQETSNIKLLEKHLFYSHSILYDKEAALIKFRKLKN